MPRKKYKVGASRPAVKVIAPGFGSMAAVRCAKAGAETTTDNAAPASAIRTARPNERESIRITLKASGITEGLCHQAITPRAAPPPAAHRAGPGSRLERHAVVDEQKVVVRVSVIFREVADAVPRVEQAAVGQRERD